MNCPNRNLVPNGFLISSGHGRGTVCRPCGEQAHSGVEGANSADNPSPQEGEGTNAGRNEGITGAVFAMIREHPGVNAPTVKQRLGASLATVERAVARLVDQGKIEHRGSKKTGGYFATEQ